MENAWGISMDWEWELEWWENHHGPEQTAFFARVALAGLPDPFVQLVRRQKLGILDWGCALGDALPVLAQAFPESHLIGLDVAPGFLARAQARYPGRHFVDGELKALGWRMPVVYTSNCLEHFKDPLGVLRQEILPWVQDYAIVLVPFLERELSMHHLATIDMATFPPVVDDFGLLVWRVIPTGQIPRTHWQGLQLLLVYARREAIGLQQVAQQLRQWQAPPLDLAALGDPADLSAPADLTD